MASTVSSQLEPWRDLDGKVVLVTGASAGLGREFCTDLAKAGCRIVAAARRADRLKSLCDEINQFATTPRAVALELDVTADRKTIEAAAQKAWAAFGRIDVLINNAGIRGGTDSSLDIAEDEWDDVFKTNLDGAWLVSKYIGRCMREAGQGGSIINISTVFGLDRVQQHGSVAYGSSKAGMNNMTRSAQKNETRLLLSKPLSPRKIAVPCPSLFTTSQSLLSPPNHLAATYIDEEISTSATEAISLDKLIRRDVSPSRRFVNFRPRIMGAILIVIGLYSVLWGKNEEKRVENKDKEETLTKHLLDPVDRKTEGCAVSASDIP